MSRSRRVALLPRALACVCVAGCFADQGPATATATVTATDVSSSSSSDGVGTVFATTRGDTDGSTGDESTTELETTATELETTSSTTGDASTGDDSSTSTGCVEVLCYPDGDGDGVGVLTPEPTKHCETCPEGLSEAFDDCDDNDENLAPTLLEVCDGQDNDCDALVDEHSPENASCNGCVTYSGEYGELWFCAIGKSWHGAREYCMDLGESVDLAVLTGLDEHAYVADAVTPPPHAFWVGLADEVVEGEFGWVDGTPLDYEPWADGEPNNLQNEDCANLDIDSDGRLSDFDCDLELGFICKAPAR